MNQEAQTDKPKRARRAWRTLRRVLLMLLAIVLLLLIFIWIFAGPITERYIERNDVELTGREIDIGDVRVHLLTGKVEITDFTVMEANARDTFIHAHRIFADLEPFKAFKDHIYLSETRIDRLMVSISHNQQVFNFDDLLQFYREQYVNNNTAPDTKEPSEPWDISLYNIHVDSCRFNYYNEVLDARITVDPFYYYTPAFSTLLDTFSAHTDLRFLKRGQILTSALVDLDKMQYLADLDIIDVPIDYLHYYLKDYLDISEFSGSIDIDISASGQVNDVEQLAWAGRVEFDSLLVTDRANDSLFAIERFTLNAERFDHAANEFDIYQLEIYKPYLRFELYPDGDNFSQLLMFDIADVDTLETGEIFIPGREYFNVFVYLADYAQMIVNTYQESNFKFDSAVVRDGRLVYVDHTLFEDALFLFENLNMTTHAFDSEDSRVGFRISSTINKSAHFKAKWLFDPHDVLEMELEAETTGFLVVATSPYSYFYTAHPFNSGKAIHRGTLTIKDRQLEGNNYIYVEDVEVGRKGFADPQINLPLKLAISILRDKNGDIELEVPVRGDLDDPKYKLGPAILTVLGNNLEKLIVAPYRLFANMFSVDEDDLKQVNWVYGQFEIDRPIEQQVNSISKVLEEKYDLALVYTPINNAQKEAEYLAIFDSKARYYSSQIRQDSNAILTMEDTMAIGSINTSDSLFVEYLKVKTKMDGLTSPTEMSMMYMGVDNARALVTERESIRDSIFKLQFLQEGIATSRIMQIPPDTTVNLADTFNLSGPVYMLSFTLSDLDARVDSLTTSGLE